MLSELQIYPGWLTEAKSKVSITDRGRSYKVYKYLTFLLCLAVTTSIFIIPAPVRAGQFAASDRTTIRANVTKRNFVTAPYKLAPGDILSFSVNEEPDFTQEEIIIRPDGYVTIRPLGQISVAGMEIEELTRHLEDLLVKYVNNPEIYVDVKQFHVPRLYLMGAVMKPGAYQPVRQTTQTSPDNSNKSALNNRTHLENINLSIFNVLVSSGGVRHNADLTRVKITRGNGEERMVDLFALLLRGDRSQDILLEEGDTVSVPQLDSFPYGDEEFKLLTASGLYPEQFPVRVLGAVEKPGLYYISSDTPYLNTAVALATGYKEGAVRNSVLIHRRARGEDMAKVVVNPQKIDYMLRPNDVIEVKGGKTHKTVVGAERASRIALPFVWLIRR